MGITNLFSYSNKLNYKKEIIGGLINFLAIAYIIVVNPLILNIDGQGFPISGTVTATIIVIVILSALAGVIVKLPFAIAPGMGLNAIISYTLIINQKLPIPIALGVVFWSGILLLIFVLTNLQNYVLAIIPKQIQQALPIGIGLLLIFIGIKQARIVVDNPYTLISMGELNLDFLLCMIGVIVASALYIRKKIYALIFPIFAITIIEYLVGNLTIPEQMFTRPDFSLFLQINFVDSLKFSLLPTILSLFLVCLFDGTSSILGILLQINDREILARKDLYFKRGILMNSLGGIASGLAGTSNSVVFIESSSALQNEARTGLASLVTAIICIPFLFLSPIINLIPKVATAPTLITIGILMVSHIKTLKIKAFEELVAVSLTILFMPFCFSITAGAVFGILSYTLLKLLLGKYSEVPLPLLILAMFCLIWLFIK